MLAHSSEDDNLQSRFIVCRSLLGATACIPQDSLDPQFGQPPTDGWPNGVSQPDLGRHAESLCHGVPRKLGQESALGRVLIQ
jgi:hypothetical protein